MLRFVFTKSRLRTRYKSLFLVFSGKLHDAIMSGMRKFSWRTTFFENVFVDVDSESDVLEIVWNLFCLA